ncbi:NADH-quinone oxidoreductase subunit NuoF [Candidatus Caldatribacterium sp.]|uniref:NADH-quinone oxidoreductase subunit NuoF n=1 Tax=Candidatus Caldatribacterium sp. TaxID=2282143 RepID=UPI0029946C3B|nr:NADH-quinone oxidoreductase subunit NuoF [Candidatus Calescibacterium sp.]
MISFERSQILLCAGAACISSGAFRVKEALLREMQKNGLEGEVRLVETGCVGPCNLGPLAIVYPEGVFYQKLSPEDAEEIVREHLLKGRIVERLLYQPPQEERKKFLREIAFFGKQKKIALRNCGLIDPLNIEEYIARDGYMALAKVLTEMTPDDVIEVVKRSGLRGRGGAGFPTGLKWEFTRKAKGVRKYVICNADEGDPGAFMDRSILEGDPHSVLEAMAIAGYAVGANEGYIYVRAEYPLAVERLQHAIEQAREYGLLGKDILGTDFSFDIEIRIGAGAFVCGEETALIASVEGKRGMPRPKPPFPAQQGLWGQPTVINNVETYANIPPIILNGPEWFRSIGTENSKGTKVFALAGDVVNTGLVEVPMGITLGEIVYDLGGGIRDGKRLKAVQIGGPSGGCIPVEHLNVQIDYDSLKELGAIMGSGGLIVMDEDTCMVDLARFFLEFVQDESCGKCTPCRIGTKRMLEILERIVAGEGKEGDIELLEDLAEQIKSTALCGLGQTAPNPVLSTLRYFREEYEAHIREKRCPAVVCRALFRAPCQHACPLGIDIPAYVALAKEGDYIRALEVIREDNPLPSVCGRVCHRPCEAKCRRGQLDEPVAIDDIKRFVADYARKNRIALPVVLERKRDASVAVVGSGPAGLTCAYYLARFGYDVTVFEALPIPGGMLAVGIPPYRLPREALEYDLAQIKASGVRIECNKALGRDFTLSELRQKFDAVFLGIGAWKNVPLGVLGEDLDGVVPALEFLKRVNLGEEVPKPRKAVVIGGGNAAMDAARTLLRLGAEVHVAYRRTRGEMPAIPEEIEDAEKEGVVFHFLVAPLEIVGENGKVKGVRFQRMRLGAFDRSGRRRPVPVEGAEFFLDCDLVVSAVGQKPDLTGIAEGIELDAWGNIKVDRYTLSTTLDGVFAGGDAIGQEATVVHAMALGKKAAHSIHEYLRKKKGEEAEIVVRLERPKVIEEPPVLEEIPRVCPPELPVAERIRNFAEVKLCFDEESARREAARCLRCDLEKIMKRYQEMALAEEGS